MIIEDNYSTNSGTLNQDRNPLENPNENTKTTLNLCGIKLESQFISKSRSTIKQFSNRKIPKISGENTSTAAMEIEETKENTLEEEKSFEGKKAITNNKFLNRKKGQNLKIFTAPICRKLDFNEAITFNKPNPFSISSEENQLNQQDSYKKTNKYRNSFDSDATSSPAINNKFFIKENTARNLGSLNSGYNERNNIENLSKCIKNIRPFTMNFEEEKENVAENICENIGSISTTTTNNKECASLNLNNIQFDTPKIEARKPPHFLKKNPRQRKEVVEKKNKRRRSRKGGKAIKNNESSSSSFESDEDSGTENLKYTKAKNIMDSEEDTSSPYINYTKYNKLDSSNNNVSLFNFGPDLIDENKDFMLIRHQSSTSFSLTTPKFDEEYVILKTLSNGEMGTVYLCMKFQDNSPYAVKVTKHFSKKIDYLNMKKFVEITEKNSQDSAYNFIQKYKDFWIENDEEEQTTSSSKGSKRVKNMYIVTNYLPNGNLKDYLSKLRESLCFVFSEEFCWDIVFEMIISVSFLHKIKYVHFDIKPTNYLITNDGHVILTDFCLSQDENSLLKEAEVEGDSVYISPECLGLLDKNEGGLIKKCKITHKSDLFSLGLSILEVLSSIELPKNGEIWNEIRTKEIPGKFYDQIPDFKSKNSFKNLVENLTKIQPESRVELEQVLEDGENYPEIYRRWNSLNKGEYVNSVNPLNIKDFKQEKALDFNINKNINAAFTKRSDSMKFSTQIENELQFLKDSISSFGGK